MNLFELQLNNLVLRVYFKQLASFPKYIFCSGKKRGDFLFFIFNTISKVYSFTYFRYSSVLLYVSHVPILS